MTGTTLRNGLTAFLMLFPWLSPAAETETPPQAASSAPGDTASTLAAANDYQQEIDRLKERFGPFDPQLGEQLLSLGLVYQRLGRYPDAVQALKQSLHIKRVNEGLQNLNQLPILEKVIETNIAAEDWNELDQNYEQLLWVHRRNYGNTDPRLLPIIDKIGRWKIQAYTEHLLKAKPASTIADAQKLYGRTVDILTREYGETDPRLIDPLYGEALVSYQYMIQIANTPLDQFSSRGAFSDTHYVQQCFRDASGRVRCMTVAVSDPTRALMEAQREKDMNTRKYLNTSGQALKQIVAIHDAHPELPGDSLAKALVHYGDWNLLAGNNTEAIDAYRRANQVLRASGAKQEDIDSYFGSPKRIPTLRLPLPAVEKQLEETHKPAYVVATVDISNKGKAHNVEIVEESNPENVSVRRQAKERLKQGVYRPRFENGEPVDTTGYRIRFTQ